MHANVIHEGSEIEVILESDNVHVLERGRETRPTAPVLCDRAEENRKREEIHIAITKGEDDRRRETRPSAPVENHHAHRGPKERRRTQKRRESGPPWKGAHRRRTSE